MELTEADMRASWLKNLPNIVHYFLSKQVTFDSTGTSGKTYCLCIVSWYILGHFLMLQLEFIFQLLKLSRFLLMSIPCQHGRERKQKQIKGSLGSWKLLK